MPDVFDTTSEAPADIFDHVGNSQDVFDQLKPDPPPSQTPELDKAVAQTAGQAVISRAKAFVEGTGIPTSVQGVKDLGKFLIRSPVQDVKEIAQDISQIPGRVRNFGQTISQSPAAQVYQHPLSPESFGTYGTVVGGTLLPKVLEKAAPIKGGPDASKVGSATEVPVREVRGEVGQETPLQQQGQTAGKETPIPPQAETVLVEPKGGEVNEAQKTRSEAAQSNQPQGAVPQHGVEQEPISEGQPQDGGQSSGKLRDEVSDVKGGGEQTPPPAPTGISQAKTEAELGPGSVEPGIGADLGSGIIYGRDYINKGGDPRLPIRRAEASGLVGRREVGIVHAELERLRGERNKAAAIAEANPNDPVAQANLDAADKAQRQWRKELQPVLTKASDALREAYAGSAINPDVGTYRGLADLMDEHFKGKRDVTPEDRTYLQKLAKGVKDTRGEAAETVNRAVNELERKAPKRMTAEQLRSDIARILKEELYKDCAL